VKLYLLRHGIADQPDWSGPDSDRPLNAEGIESLQKSAKRLAKLTLEPGLILHSPYVRAKQTAVIVATALEATARLREDARLAPGFGIELLGQILKENAAAAALMLVGHNPDFEEVASAVIGGGSISVGKGAVACIEIETVSSRPAGSLKWLASKKLLAK
jgi:phosphohistidine phosphatase